MAIFRQIAENEYVIEKHPIVKRFYQCAYTREQFFCGCSRFV